MRALYAPAAIVISFVLALLLFSCSAGQSERETGEDRANADGTGAGRAGGPRAAAAWGGGGEGAGSWPTRGWGGGGRAGGPQASSAGGCAGLRSSLVPVAHLTSV